MDRVKAIRKINHYACSGTPFLFITDFEGLNTAVLTLNETEILGIRFSIRREPGKIDTLSRSFTFSPVPVDYDVYTGAFEKVSWHLRRGDTYLINLTFPTELDTDLTPEETYECSRAPFRLLYPGRFVVFSPEPFVRIKSGIIYSNPMKGTIDASLPDAENKLLGDKKEEYEHNTIVDLIRNELSVISSSVTVSRFRYIEKIATNRGDLLQMSSEINGKMPDDYLEHLGEDLFSLLPAGSVSGAPKKATVRIIREAEQDERGFYTGVFGFFDGSSFTSAVMIRFIEYSEGRFRFRSGGGITALSECRKEYEELIAKVYVPFI